MRGAKPERALEERFAAEIATLHGGEDAVVVAASGGPDSTALAALYRRVRPRAPLVLAHVNHGLRTGAWQDEAVTVALGTVLGVPVRTVDLRPRPTSPPTGAAEGEAALRAGRYAALAAVAAREGARLIATAHSADDQTETVLLALFRGTGLAGLAGMRPLRPLRIAGDAAGRDPRPLLLVRPLLGVAHGELRRYCERRGLPYALDPGNDDPRYRRNAVRRALRRLRRDAFPDLDAAVARCAATVRAELERAGGGGGGAERVAEADHRSAVHALLARLGVLEDVTAERIAAVVRALSSEGRGRPRRVFLSRGVALTIDERRETREPSDLADAASEPPGGAPASVDRLGLSGSDGETAGGTGDGIPLVGWTSERSASGKLAAEAKSLSEVPAEGKR